MPLQRLQCAFTTPLQRAAPPLRYRRCLAEMYFTLQMKGAEGLVLLAPKGGYRGAAGVEA